MAFDFNGDAKNTNEEFANELARLTTLTTVDVKKLFPRKVDKVKFEQLMQIVNSSASRNKRTAAIQSNIETFGTTITKILEQLT